MGKNKKLISVELTADDRIVVTTDLDRLDTEAVDKRTFSETMLSYVPAFRNSVAELSPKALQMCSIMLAIMYASWCSCSDNGREGAQLVKELYDELIRGNATREGK